MRGGLSVTSDGRRKIAVVTGSRADYSISRSLLAYLAPRSGLQILVTGQHLDPAAGETGKRVSEDGFSISASLPLPPGETSRLGMAFSLARGTEGFAKVLEEFRPDILVLVGDRYEMLSAGLAALALHVPCAHLHGGEITEGALDDSIRHSLTKLSHLHFVSYEGARNRVIQMGEEPWRVTLCGAPALDALRAQALLSRERLERALGLEAEEPFIVVSLHPTTNLPDLGRAEADATLQALSDAAPRLPHRMIVTGSNLDPGGEERGLRLREFAEALPRASFISNLGSPGFFSALKWATALVGNSSSGILEAASFELPVVNIGLRQRGRFHAENVIDVSGSAREITDAIFRAVSPEFRASLVGLRNPYDRGEAASVIGQRLLEVAIDDTLRIKRFHELSTNTKEHGPCVTRES
jgi:UDP-hydrolysing UDP-N-acetyl-D-glucosamine 2-epimerase